MSIAITAWEYLFEKNFNEQIFEHRDSRIMDKQAKIVVSMSRQLYSKVRGTEIPSESHGIVFFSEAGPIESILEYNSVLREKGYVGINPSKFPNIMSTTTLSRIAIEIGAKGPCVSLLSHNINKHALMYAVEQITAGRCKAMMIIHITRRYNCFGCFIENEDLYSKRGLQSKLIISEKR